MHFRLAGQDGDVRGHGYKIDEATSRPVFNFTYQGLQVEDKVYPDDKNRMITHEVVIKDRGSKPGLYYKLAEGSAIQALEGDLYVVDDKQYYIKVNSFVATFDSRDEWEKGIDRAHGKYLEIFNYLVRLKSKSL